MATPNYKDHQRYAKNNTLGMFADQDGGWHDVIGQIVPAPLGPANPSWTILTAGSPFYGWSFGLNDFVNIYFHMPHGYAGVSNGRTSPTGVYIHAHWMTNGTSTNTVKWQFTYSFARGFNQSSASTFNTTGTVVTCEEAGSGTAFQHMTTEIANPITDSDLEVDGLFMVQLKRITNGGTENSDTVFLMMSDMHIQMDSVTTKNRAPNFYT